MRNQLLEGLEHLRPQTRALLSSLKEASPELRRLALRTSPFAVRSELYAHGLATQDLSCDLTVLGQAALEVVQPLTADARETLAAEAHRALVRADREAAAEQQAANTPGPTPRPL
ncbi:MAG TPA: hypothetical protein VF529_00960 [Solirubrobacteraceae bacterium]